MPAKKPVKPKTGRPSKLTDDVQTKILQAIQAGNWLETASAYAGVDASTVRRWMAKGESEDAEEPYRAFCALVKQARAQAEIRAVALIQKAAQDGTWQASAWYLERSHPDRWGRKRLEITGADSQPVRVEVDVDSLESKLKALLDKDNQNKNGN
jgi:transposase